MRKRTDPSRSRGADSGDSDLTEEENWEQPLYRSNAAPSPQCDTIAAGVNTGKLLFSTKCKVAYLHNSSG